MNLFGFLFKPREVLANHVGGFVADLSDVAPPAGRGAYSFSNPDGSCRGFVQFIVDSPQQVTIHRLWTIKPGEGHGSQMMSKLCELADLHKVKLKLKVLPIGRMPYPLSREQLFTWYQRFGFEGTLKKMTRNPVVGATA